MPSTPVYSLPYPGPDEAPNGPTELAALAAALETALTNRITDTGLTTVAVTPSSGWSIASNSFRAIGKEAFLRLGIQRTGGTINGVAGSTWNLSPDLDIATITDATRIPVLSCFANFRSTTTGGSAQLSAATGLVTITDLHTGSSIAVNDTVNVYFSYPLP